MILALVGALVATSACSRREDTSMPQRSTTPTASVPGSCRSQPSVLRDPSNADITRETWPGCRDGATVELVEVEGANHAWMGHEAPRASVVLAGESYRGLDSSLTIWAFLAGRTRR